jgi:signal transduction histidine kinase
MNLTKGQIMMIQNMVNTELSNKNTVYNPTELVNLKEQLTLYNVVSSSDKIVIELSDEELQIVTRQELSKMQDDAMEFDGFKGWIVRGKLAIIK